MKEELLKIAAKEADNGQKIGDGGPFGAVVASKDGEIISIGHNRVLKDNDPTAHAEVVAIRNACLKLDTHDLHDYVIYSGCEPCPMCLSAIIWANIKTVYYGATRDDAAKIGFRDKDIYDFLSGNNKLINKEYVKNDSCIAVLEKYNGEMY